MILPDFPVISNPVFVNGCCFYQVTDKRKRNLLYRADPQRKTITKTLLGVATDHVPLKVWPDGTLAFLSVLPNEALKKKSFGYETTLLTNGKRRVLSHNYSLFPGDFDNPSPELSPYASQIAMINTDYQAVIAQWPSMKVSSTSPTQFGKCYNMMWIGANYALLATTKCAIIRYKYGRYDLVKPADHRYRYISFSPLGNGMFMRDFHTGQTVFYSLNVKSSYPVCNELGPSVAFAHNGHQAVVWKFKQKHAYVYDLDRNTVRRITLPHNTHDIMSDANVHKQTGSIPVITVDKSWRIFTLTTIKI